MPGMGERLNKLCSPYPRKPHIAIKKDELELDQLLWQGFYEILREKSKTQKIFTIISFL